MLVQNLLGGVEAVRNDAAVDAVVAVLRHPSLPHVVRTPRTRALARLVVVRELAGLGVLVVRALLTNPARTRRLVQRTPDERRRRSALPCGEERRATVLIGHLLPRPVDVVLNDGGDAGMNPVVPFALVAVLQARARVEPVDEIEAGVFPREVRVSKVERPQAADAGS